MVASHRYHRSALATVLIGLSTAGAWCAGFSRELPKDFRPQPQGDFASPRSQSATYSFGWSAVKAAEGKIRLENKPERIQFHGAVHTTGMVRTLWRMDATLESTLRAKPMRSLRTEQIENYRSEKIVTKLAFDDAGVLKSRQEIPQDAAPKTKRFRIPGILDLFGAVVRTRSQRLKDGDVYTVAVFPDSSPYLARAEVLGRETLEMPAGRFKAIKIGLQLRQVDKKGRLLEAKKFRSGSVWFSDDADRLLLRVESEVFVGAVWVNLVKVEFN